MGGTVPKPTIGQFKAARKEAKAWRVAFEAGEESALERGKDTGSKAVLEALIKQADKLVPRRAIPGSGRRPDSNQRQGKRSPRRGG